MRLLSHKLLKHMETLLANGINWLSRQVPGLAFVIFIMISTVWVTVMITNFSHRLSETERLVNDINTRQLPEMKANSDKKFAEIEQRLTRIELQLNTIITYIETKEGIKLKSP